ncbi:MAG: hypothetical protein SGARI_006956, partial [Bacillariaceae sp.]
MDLQEDDDYDGGAAAMLEGEKDAAEYVDSIYASLKASSTPPVDGWFIPDLANFHQGVDVFSTSRFFCEPREWDQAPSDVPVAHPLRAIADVLDKAPNRSLVRVWAYSLTDPYAIDMLTHHSKFKTMRVILHPDRYSVEQILKFCRNIPSSKEGDPIILIKSLVQIRVAKMNAHHCEYRSSMHRKAIITASKIVVGSYNLSCLARCKNAESVYVVDTTEADKNQFDATWKSLEG